MKNKFLVTSMILLIIVLIANIVFASQEGENNNSNTVNVNKTENNLIENQKISQIMKQTIIFQIM